jgi:hypothetical protein
MARLIHDDPTPAWKALLSLPRAPFDPNGRDDKAIERVYQIAKLIPTATDRG